ncbi:MAG TPA: tRNA lysidine(34) synthetase TilS [Candidatus Sulfotelmatobacter sp.]|jgi:tRNA(Ile)-lysidine synthase|nr:tRNA lysidine(34) synthetase TilS [Candidatus Sulfotelmatobacter sp.]
MLAMYHVSVHELAERVLGHIRREELLRAGDRVGVAVSGGIDSVALLRLLIELRHDLGVVISVVHFNHGLRGAESEVDRDFVAGLAREHGLEFHVAGGNVARLAAEEHSGLEAAARELRYGFFRLLLGSAEVDEVEPDVPQGLEPESSGRLVGTAEVVPFPNFSQPSVEAPPTILDAITTGHTLDDQAETVLMRVIRGTGLRGLGGIYPRLLVERVDEEGHGEIVRPLLGIRRRELEQYLVDLKQPWREDSTNADSKFTRNRVRQLVLPLLEQEFNPAVVENLSELAEIARDEEDYWENEISGWLGTVVQWSQPEWACGLPGFEGSQKLVQIQPSLPKVLDPKLVERLEQPGPAVMNASVSRPWLLTEPRAVQRRVVKAIGDQALIPLEFKHIEEILRFAAENGPSGKELSLPLGWKIRREPEAMVFLTPDLRSQERIPDYEYSLTVPGRVLVAEAGIVIEAWRLTAVAQVAEYNPQQLLRGDLLPGRLIVRNWRAGDRYWPAHTKAPKKIKELLQERHVARSERRLWPVAVSGDEIVWMRGFPVPARLRANAEQEAVLIREAPWMDEDHPIL